MSTIPSFKSTENKRDVYRSQGCIKKFCEETIKFKKKKWTLLK